MNDPNGLCEFQGINHIYFQYTRFGRLGNETMGTLYDNRLDSFSGVRAVPVSGL